jgi:alpha-glucosidase
MADSEFAGVQWWQTGVVYQVYPRSFQDTDGDGVGDLRGITARLDYLKGLGVDAVWISPIYPSPMADFGYDVADYTDVDRLFGTLEDFDTLLAEAHRRGLRIILDFVPNHSSDLHPWFRESKSSRLNKKRDWYLWRDPAPAGGPDDARPPQERFPNNWTSHFGGPSWTWDPETEQFYLHSFLREQPDLNWRNPELKAAMFAAMRFWLDRGVDGFRMDVLWLLIKDAQFRDNPPNPDYNPGMHDHTKTLPVYNSDQPETHAIVAEMRALLDSYGATIAEKPLPGTVKPSHRVLIGEIYLPLDELVQYYGLAAQTGGAELATPETPETGPRPGANLPFNFHLIQTEWTAQAVAHVINTYEGLLPAGAWPNYVLGNHDQPRLASRVGALQARAAAMMLLTLRGTPTLYYGDELGMEDVPIALDEVRDPAEKNEPGKGRGRDPERSPMLWVNAPNAGFCPPEAKPWLPLLRDWPERNAAVQRADKRSMLTLYRRLLQLRRQHDTLHAGAIAGVVAEGNLLRYTRVGLPEGDSADFLILLNLGTEPVTTECPPGTLVLTTLLDGAGARIEEPTVTVEGGEGLLIALD